MALKLHYFFFSILLICGSKSDLLGQKSPADSLLLETMKTELKMTADQVAAADSVMRSSGEKIAVVDKEIMRVSRSDMNEADRNAALADLREKKRILREEKETQILLYLNDEQKKNYSEKIKPVKPPVFHMGMNHDRANCNVCLPK